MSERYDHEEEFHRHRCIASCNDFIEYKPWIRCLNHVVRDERVIECPPEDNPLHNDEEDEHRQKCTWVEWIVFLSDFLEDLEVEKHQVD